jgi:hypothetical protein
MARDPLTLDQKAAWMREKHSTAPGLVPSQAAFAERHYSVAEVAAMWHLSQDAVRKIFDHEPGVMVLGDQAPRHKRKYTTLRIPESVVQRVHRRMSNG